jgi:hypothetical protein
MFKVHRSYSLSTGVKNNSIAVINNGSKLTVVYHSTAVVQKTGKTITLMNGGWDTVSTRAVINRALEQLCSASAHLFRKKGETFLFHNGITEPFISGMTLKCRNETVST